MKLLLLPCWIASLALTGSSWGVEKPAPVPFEITAKEAGTLAVTIVGDRAVFSIKGGNGIGHASVRRLGDAWPKQVVVRIYLGGLEQFNLSDAVVKLSASASSHGGNRQLLHLSKDGIESPAPDEKSPYWIKIRHLNANGKEIQGLPPEGGWFEITIPKALLKGPSVDLDWIDFYR